MATRAIEDSTGLKVLGAVPRLKLDMPERHMGLVPPQEHEAVTASLEKIGREVASRVDVDALLDLMQRAEPWTDAGPPEGLYPETPPTGEPVRIGVIRDAAFGFYLCRNLEALENFGPSWCFAPLWRTPPCRKWMVYTSAAGFPKPTPQSFPPIKPSGNP